MLEFSIVPLPTVSQLQNVWLECVIDAISLILHIPSFLRRPGPPGTSSGADGARFVRLSAPAGRAGLGKLLYTNGNATVIRSLADPRDAECVVLPETRAPQTCAQFSPNGEWIASGDASGAVRVWGALLRKLSPLRLGQRPLALPPAPRGPDAASSCSLELCC